MQPRKEMRVPGVRRLQMLAYWLAQASRSFQILLLLLVPAMELSELLEYGSSSYPKGLARRLYMQRPGQLLGMCGGSPMYLTRLRRLSVLAQGREETRNIR